MEILTYDLQETILRKLFYADFRKSSFLFSEYVVKELEKKYKKSVEVIEKWICKRRYYHKGELVWITKFNYHLVNGHKVYYQLKYDSTYIRGEIVLPFMNIRDKCHHHCTNCGHFYPTIFCLIICRQYCNCQECNKFVKENIIGGYCLKTIKSKYLFS